MGQGPVVGTYVATTPGSVVAGRYLVERFLGEGGMATVLEVRDLRTERRLALKILKPEIAAHPEAVERFRREGEFLSSLKHPALITVDAIGTLADSRLFLAMELLTGETLGERIRRGRLSPTEISPILAGAAVGLDAAHRSGVVHRDLKPDNVFLATSAPGAAMQVKLLDFGISKIDGRASLTRTGQVLGTPRYMAPEQLRGEDDLDARVDVYALGVILYEALAGAPAFPAQQPSDLILAILNGRFVPLRAIRPDIGGELEGVVIRAMSKTREARFANAIELAEAWFAVVHRNDGPKAVRAGVATNILGSVAHSVPPPKSFSSEDLRPATFREFEAAQKATEPKPRPLADLVSSPALATPEATSPAHVPPQRSRAAAVAFSIDPRREEPSPAPAAESVGRPVAEIDRAAHPRVDSEPPRLPTTRTKPWVFALGFVALVALGAFVVSATSGREHAAVGSDSGVRFVNVPLVFVDAGPATTTTEDADVAPSAKLDAGTAASIATGVVVADDTRPDRNPDPSTDTVDPRARTRTDSGTHPTRESTQTTADPWTGDTDESGRATTAPTGQSLLAEARAAYSSGDARRCIELASEAIAAGADASVYRLRGDCYRSIGDTAHALRSYQRYCTLAPHSSQIEAVRSAAEALGGSCP